VRSANDLLGAFPRVSRLVSRRRAEHEARARLAGSTAILIVNSFDRHSASPFDVEEARRFPWIKLCLEQLDRHTPSSLYEVIVWDDPSLPEHLSILEAHPRVSMFSAEGKDVRRGRGLDHLLGKVRAGDLQLEKEQMPVPAVTGVEASPGPGA
jgi:hypothetical protein